jgi:hypothetical protein
MLQPVVTKSPQAADGTGAGGSDTLTRTNYVTVTSAAVGDLVMTTITYALVQIMRGQVRCLRPAVLAHLGGLLGYPGIHLHLHHSTGSGQAYDAVGNPVSATLRGTNGRTAMTKAVGSTVAFTHVYEYDDGDQPALSETEGLTKVDDQAYTWDANGNLLNDGTRTFTLRYTQDAAYDAAPVLYLSGPVLVRTGQGYRTGTGPTGSLRW